MIKKLFLPLFLLVATPAFGVSSVLEGLLAGTNAVTKYEQLPAEDQTAIETLCTDIENLFANMSSDLDALANRHQDASKKLKEILGTEGLALNVDLTTVPTVCDQNSCTNCEVVENS